LKYSTTSKYYSADNLDCHFEEEDIFDEKAILDAATANYYDSSSTPTADANESEATPKMEKKSAIVSQIFSNIKMKFGSTASRKRSKY